MRSLVRRVAVTAGGVGLTGAMMVSLAVPQSSAAGASRGAVNNPYSPAYGHTYRHGVVPTVAQNVQMKRYALSHGASTSTGPETLGYGGGVDGIGVTSGTPKVYLVFWGNWGTQGTGSNGNLTFTRDPDGGAPYIQNLFKGLGTNNELWSGTMTQYCDGSTVAYGATSCPAGAPHVGYPTGGVLAGVWYDTTSEPTAASGHQLAQEAVNAAGHFGNTTAASNRYVQYDILSPTGYDPDSYEQGGFCAWHDYNGDSTLDGGGAASSPYGDIAFTNMPYVMDLGYSCGAGFVNSPGTLDGYSIVNGHEYAETVTDQNPAGGWTNLQNLGYYGEEDGDECAWISSGQGASANVAMGTGSFAMQSTWSNDTNRCDITHSIVTGTTSNDFSISDSPTAGTATAGHQTTTTVSTAVTSGSAQTVSLSASGLPSGTTAGFSPSSVTAGASSTLTITTSSTTPAGTYNVTITGTGTSATHTASYSLTVNSVSGSGPNVITNGGFEAGTFSGWSRSGTASVVTTNPHSGFYAAQAGATTRTRNNSSVSQTFTAASGDSTVTFWYDVVCADTVSADWATATLKDVTAGTTSTPLGRTCVSNSGWVKVTAPVVAGHQYTLTLTNHDDYDSGPATYTHFDDVSTS